MKKLLTILLLIIFFNPLVFSQSKVSSDKSKTHLFNNGGTTYSSGETFSTTAIIGQTFFGASRNNSHYVVTGLWSSYLLPPQPPTVFASQGDYPNRNRIEWAFDVLSPPADEQIQILRNGALLSTVAGKITDFQDFNIIAGEIYNYGIKGINEYGTGNPGYDLGFVSPNGTITGTVKTAKGKSVVNSEVKVTPITGSSVKFSSLDDYLKIPITKVKRRTGDTTGTIDLKKDFTIEFWFKRVGTDTSSTINILTNDTNSNGVNISIIGNQAKLNLTSSDAIITRHLDLKNNWHHLAFTKKYSSGSLKVYLDGELVDSTNIAVNKITDFTTQNIYFGKSATPFFIDDIRIWKSAKSFDEIKRDHERTGSTLDTNLIAYWNLNEGLADHVLDLSNNKHHGRLYKKDLLQGLDSTDLWNKDIPAIYASVFSDGNGEFVVEGLAYGGGRSFNIVPEMKVPSGRTFTNIGANRTAFRIPYDSLFPRSVLTIEAWVKPNKFDSIRYILSAAYDGINLGINTDRRVFTKFKNNTTVTSTAQLTLNTWTHIAMIIDNSGTRFFINGVPSGQNSYKAIEYEPRNSNYIIIGGGKESTSHFDGLIDEVRFWNIARLQAELEEAKSRKLKGDESGLFSYFHFNEGNGTVAGNLVKSHPNASLVQKTSDTTFTYLALSEPQSSSYFSKDIPNKANEDIVHQFMPSQKRVNLNSSITSVDRIEFQDVTVVPVSGYIVYEGTECFVDSVEIYVDGKPTVPKTMTNNLGYYSVELDPGRDYTITPFERDGKNDFEIKFYKVTNLTEPVSLPMFIDRTKRKLTGLVAAALVNDTVKRVVNNGLSIRLDGINDFLRVNHDASANLGNNFTLEAWVSPEKSTGTNVIISKANEYGLAIKDGKLAYLSSTNTWEKDTSITISLNNWSHVALTHTFTPATGGSSQAHTYKLFVNGSKVFTNTISTNAISNGNRDLFFGADSISSLNNYFTGNIAEIKIWNVANSDSIVNLKKSNRLFPKNESNLMAYYTFADENGKSFTGKLSSALINGPIIEGFPKPLFELLAGGTSAISGSITDKSQLQSDYSLDDTRVTVRAINGCLTKTVVVNPNGTFTVEDLPPNFYIVSVMHPAIQVTQAIAPKRVNLLDVDGNVNFDYRAKLNADISGLQGALSKKDIIVPDKNSTDKFKNIGKRTILTSGREVDLEINVFEDYMYLFKNPSRASHTNVLDSGSILVVDNISGKPPTWFPVGKSGLSYTLNPTDPYIVEGGDNPFQKFIAISARDLSGNSIPSPIIKFAIVKGSIGKERTFSTTSPVNLDLILHDPPGDQSFASMSKGFTFSTKTGRSSVSLNTAGFDANTLVGASVTTFAGVGLGAIVGTIIESSGGVAAGLKVNAGSSVNKDQSSTRTVTMAETFTTESSSDFIGAEGDVFVGHADNVIYGNADILQIKVDSTSNNDSLKIKSTIFFFPGMPTYFAYPQSFIQDNLIPKLQENAVLTKAKKDEYIRTLQTTNRDAYNYLSSNSGWDKDTSSNATEKRLALTKKDSLRTHNRLWYEDHFKSILMNHDSSIYFRDWAANWALQLQKNDSNKIKAKDIAFNNVAPDGKPLDPAWNGENKKNLSFAAGSPRTFSMSTTNSFSRTTSNTILINEEFYIGTEFEIKAGMNNETSIHFTQEHSTELTDEQEATSDTTTEISYTLQDDDKGDNFTTNVWRDPYFATPVFELVAAETSCPYEGPVVAGEPSATGYSTRARDKITLAIQPIRITNIFPGEEAVFKIKLVNTGEVNQDASRTIRLRIPQETNPRGAKIAINGVLVEQYLEVDAPLRQEVNLMLTIQRGPNTDTLNAPFSGLRLEAYPCDEDRNRGRVVSEILAPFNFLESCGSVKLEMIVSPTNFGNPWVLSPTNAVKKDTIKITAYNYNINDPNFTQLEIQYREKPQLPGGGFASGVIGESTVNAIQSKGFSLDSFNWNAVKGGIKPVVVKDDYNSTIYSKETEFNYSNGLDIDKEVKTLGSKEKVLPTILGDPRWIRLPIGKDRLGNSQDFVTIDSLRKRSVSNQFDYFLSLQNPFPILDGSYEFRAVAVCNKGLVPGMSEIYTGVIDRAGPKVIRREPHDGVLQENDEISILFDEKIDKNDIEKNLSLRVLLENEDGNLPIDYRAIVYDNKISIIPNVQMSTLESKTLRVQIVTMQQVGGKMVPVEGELNNRPLDIYSTPTPSRSETKWSFYVDQSPIKWSVDQITITTTADKNFEPKVIKLNNNSGSIVNYSLSNFPSWMEITPKAGSLSPGSSEDISIQIRSSEVGIGEKNTTLKVNTPYGIEELKIRTRKIATPPTWVVNPANFENVMNMIAEVNLPTSGRIETGHAKSFNGTTEDVTVPHNSALNISGNFTIESWLLLNSRTSKLTPATNWHTIAAKGFNTLIAANDYSLAIETGTTNSRLGFFVHGAGTAYSNNFTFELNQFYHIAVTRTSDVIKFYVNGLEVGSQSFTHNAANSSPLKIGSGFISTNVSGVTIPAPAMVSGVIDEFRFWNVGRSSVEINNKMETNLVGNETGLIAYYKFDETSGTTTRDLTANSFNGTTSSSSAWTTNAPLIGNSRSFVASNDELDMVSAFVGNDIRGVGAVRYVPEKQKYLTFLPIYSNNVTGEDLTFRVWDASAGIEWIRTKERYRFVKDTIVGTVTSPAKISIDPAVEKMYALNAGWNWLSLNTTPISLNLNDVYNGPEFKTSDIIKSQTQFAVFTKDTAAGVGTWSGSLTALNTTSLFMSKISAKVNLKVTGAPLVPETTPISLSKGWNWVGFTPQSPIDIQLALEKSSSFNLRTGDIVRSQTAFSSYQENTGWIGNLNTLEPLKGYQLKMQDDNPGTLVYPTPLNISTIAVASSESVLDSIPANWSLNPALYQYSMTVVGTVLWGTKDSLSQNDYIGAFYGNEFRGVGNAVYVPALNKYRLFLIIYSNNALNDTLTFKYYSCNTKKEFSISEKVAFKANDNLGTIANPIQFTVSSSTGIADDVLPKVFALQQNYPNPFNPSTTIKYDLPTESMVNITIYSVLGQKVKTLVSDVEKAGYKRIVWDGTNDANIKVASGTYIYRITAGKFISNKKMILLR